jgi:hypothetical protein
VYLDAGVLGEALVGTAVDQPTLHDPLLRQRVDQLHRTLSRPGEELHAESRLALIVDRLRRHLRPAAVAVQPPPRRLARDLRDLIDARQRGGHPRPVRRGGRRRPGVHHDRRRAGTAALWQPLTLYYSRAFSKEYFQAIHEAMTAAGLERPGPPRTTTSPGPTSTRRPRKPTCSPESRQSRRDLGDATGHGPRDPVDSPG